MLRSELKDRDIPHRTTLRTRILERLNEHFETLRKEMAVSLSKLSYIAGYRSSH